MGKNVGFIGLGIMGRAMAGNVLAKGYGLTVYNRSMDKCRPLQEAGAIPVASPREVAASAEVVILMLTGPEAIEAVLNGDDGLLAGLAPGATVINMSTVTPTYAEKLNDELAARSVTYLDVPVSGSKKPAAEATLVLLAGGPRPSVAALEPLLLTMGKKVVYCGTAGYGSRMKMVINLLLAVMMEGLSEAVLLGNRCGLTTDAVLETVLAGPLGCGLFNLKAEMLKNDSFPTQFPFKHMHKDLGFILETARDNQAATPVAAVVRQLFERGMAEGLGELDFAALHRVLAAMK